ncbi:RNA methyltransferase PUA domain-containing protein, partial [Streptomyces sp. URMC 126]|uniref:RNA methyltransferase PUA domain-containing protein n=1 Tax=Streptomyces sp. URMC 126 TaxID=3423401 RepID=UPI003F1A9F39
DVLIDGTEGRHAVEVLRLSPGERVRVGDGQGAVAEGDVVSAGPQGLRVAVVRRFEVPPQAPEFVLVQALPKGDRG